MFYCLFDIPKILHTYEVSLSNETSKIKTNFSRNELLVQCFVISSQREKYIENERIAKIIIRVSEVWDHN